MSEVIATVVRDSVTTIASQQKIGTSVVTKQTTGTVVVSAAQGPRGPVGGLGVAGPVGPQGPPGETTIGGIPVDPVSPQAGDVLMYINGTWVNSPGLDAGYF